MREGVCVAAQGESVDHAFSRVLDACANGRAEGLALPDWHAFRAIAVPEGVLPRVYVNALLLASEEPKPPVITDAVKFFTDAAHLADPKGPAGVVSLSDTMFVFFSLLDVEE